MYLLTSADVEVVWLPLCEVLRLPRLPVARQMNYGGKRSRLSGIQSIALSISLCPGKRGGKSPINGGFNGLKKVLFCSVRACAGTFDSTRPSARGKTADFVSQ